MLRGPCCVKRGLEEECGAEERVEIKMENRRWGKKGKNKDERVRRTELSGSGTVDKSARGM